MPSPTPPDDQRTIEQHHLDAVVRRRDELIHELSARDDETSRQRARELTVLSDGMVFGRIDTDEERWRIGRVGIRDGAGDPLVLDWRAPLARAFYTATTADPHGLRSRRHIRTEGTAVLAVDDETLTGDSADLVGEAALMRALNSRRTGHMTDIVATLQAEQDAVVRADPTGCLIVQGGPGTGKTAVALHRAAYLLFTHERVARRGVLVIGPNSRFLDYIGQVLPSLAETQVVNATAAMLLPGVRAMRDEPPAVAEIKGRALWADVLGRAVASRRPKPRSLQVDWSGTTLQISERDMAALINGIAARDEPLHTQRERYIDGVIDALTEAIAAESSAALHDVEHGLEDLLAAADSAIASDPTLGVRRSDVSGADVDGALERTDAAQIARALVAEPDVIAAMAQIWPTVDPLEVLADLLGDDAQLARVAPELEEAQRRQITHAANSTPHSRTEGWSVADIALLDEISALVGAPAALGEVSQPAEETFSSRAAADRTWTYGHVIVDEAQELSAMQWRALARRCPTRSFTVVGDVNQTSTLAGTTDWAVALKPIFGDRMRTCELSVCYRTPHEVMELTPPVLRAAGSTVAPPTAARSNGIAPRLLHVHADDVAAAAATEAESLVSAYAGGQVAIIRPNGFRALPDIAGITQVNAEGCKGLEFDAVVLIEPKLIIDSERGPNLLYVAMTRCTQQLVVVASEPVVELGADDAWHSRAEIAG